MSGPSPNLALIRRVVLGIVEMADVSPYNVLTDRMITAVDHMAVVVEYVVGEKVLAVQSGWTYMQVIVDRGAIVVQQELGFLVVVVVQC